jgi:hypothetical protein
MVYFEPKYCHALQGGEAKAMILILITICALCIVLIFIDGEEGEE